jgi:hypothetical protein
MTEGILLFPLHVCYTFVQVDLFLALLPAQGHAQPTIQTGSERTHLPGP